jgi:hypothetical protein
VFLFCLCFFNLLSFVFAISKATERERWTISKRERERASLSLPLNPSFRRMVGVCVAAAVVCNGFFYGGMFVQQQL